MLAEATHCLRPTALESRRIKLGEGVVSPDIALLCAVILLDGVRCSRVESLARGLTSRSKLGRLW